MTRSIATKDQLAKARMLILRTLEKTPTTRSALSHLRMYGIPAASVDLALHLLQRDGLIEPLYSLPRVGKGNKSTYYIHANYEGELPPDTIRYAEAMELVV